MNGFKKSLKELTAVFVMICLFYGCASVGRQFPVDRMAEITTGKTLKSDIRNTFGAPWRTGIENGDQVWTYAQYKYRLFGKTDTEDLVIHFDKNGIVSSFIFNTTKHNE
jgi:outer membrane protein assembly factor BamE (lipoprotein component of BamABCDE complex)